MVLHDVYIAGAMTGRRVYDVLLERQRAKWCLAVHGLSWYDPAENEGLEKLSPHKIISNAYDLRRMKKYVKKDLAAVSSSRCVLNIRGDMPSEGSLWEMAFATYYRQIPVVLVAPQRVKGAKMTFTNILVDKMCPTLAEASKYISEVLKEI